MEKKARYLQLSYELQDAQDELVNYSNTTFVFDPKIQELTTKIKNLKNELSILYDELREERNESE